MFAFLAVGPDRRTRRDGGRRSWWVLRRGRTQEQAGATVGRLDGGARRHRRAASRPGSASGSRRSTRTRTSCRRRSSSRSGCLAAWRLEPRDAVPRRAAHRSQHGRRNALHAVAASRRRSAIAGRRRRAGVQDVRASVSCSSCRGSRHGSSACRSRGTPSSTPALGEWQPPSHVHRQGAEQPEAAPKDDPVALRYRVRRAGED